MSHDNSLNPATLQQHKTPDLRPKKLGVYPNKKFRHKTRRKAQSLKRTAYVTLVVAV